MYQNKLYNKVYNKLISDQFLMSDITDSDNEFSSLQKIIFVFISIFLVISLFFLKNEFKANSMLDQLAKTSLLPEEALANGKPTVFEFYADWCEACKEMAPSMIDIKNKNKNKVDVVLLNVDNNKWIELIDKYDVNGIPQLNFFDSKGQFKGFSIGVRKNNELNDIFLALINNTDLPNFTKSASSSNLNFNVNSKELTINNIEKYTGPRSHN